ncbi:hypothetical protein IG631_23827 [Alternaria alternata]|nr:hypothetical protein IG631_23827 [Alternaria alternata]
MHSPIKAPTESNHRKPRAIAESTVADNPMQNAPSPRSATAPSTTTTSALNG